VATLFLMYGLPYGLLRVLLFLICGLGNKGYIPIPWVGAINCFLNTARLCYFKARVELHAKPHRLFLAAGEVICRFAK